MKITNSKTLQTPGVKLTIGLWILALTGCTSAIIESAHHQKSDDRSGLVYNLPMGWIKILDIESIVNSTSTITTPNDDGKTPPEVSTDESVTKSSLISIDVVIAPDRNERYLLKMKPSAFADDFIQLKVTNGLLSSVTLTNSDQTLGILSNLVQTVVESLQAASGLPKAAKSPKATVVETSRTNYVTNLFLIDPFAEVAAGTIDKALTPDISINLSDFTSEVKALDVEAKDEADLARLVREGKATGVTAPVYSDPGGVFYRPLESFYVSVTGADGRIVPAIVKMPNKAMRYQLAANRAAFVKQGLNMNFQEGIPMSVTLNKPSQAAALTAFPLNVLKQLTGIPTNLFQFRINTGGGSASQASNSPAPMMVQTNLQQLVVASNSFQITQPSSAVEKVKP